MNIGRGEKRSLASRKEFAFHVPSYIFLTLFFIYPLFLILQTSLLKASLEQPPNMWKFIGLSNYISLNLEKDLTRIIWNTIIYAFVGSAVPLVLGMSIALLVNSLKGLLQRIISTILIIPMLILPVVGGIVWSFMFSEHYGWFNHFISMFGFKPQAWLMTPYSLWFVILTDIWGWTPWVFLIIFAGLQQLDPSIKDAASIDGASGFSRFRYVIFPMIRNLTLLVFILKLVDTYKAFDYLWVMTEGGPGTYSTTLNIIAYKYLMIYRDVGMASTFGVISMVFPILASLTILIISRGR
jgi:multiple sugar transport system permease protein